MTRAFTNAALAIVIVFVLTGCTGGLKQDSPPPSLKPASFDYVPPTEELQNPMT